MCNPLIEISNSFDVILQVPASSWLRWIWSNFIIWEWGKCTTRGRGAVKTSQSNTNCHRTVCHNLAEDTADTVGTEEDIHKQWEYELVTLGVVYPAKEAETTMVTNSSNVIREYCDKGKSSNTYQWLETFQNLHTTVLKRAVQRLYKNNGTLFFAFRTSLTVHPIS